MVNYGDLQFAERIMVVRWSEMSAEWKVRFAVCIASVAIQAFTKLLSFSDVLKATNCIFQEVDNIFRLAVGIAVSIWWILLLYVCCWIFVCIGCFCTSYIVSNHIFDTDHCRQIEGRCQLSPRYLSNFWVSWKPRRVAGCFCMVVQCSRTMLDTLLSAGWYVMTNDTLLIVFFSLFWMRSVNTPCFAKAMV